MRWASALGPTIWWLLLIPVVCSLEVPTEAEEANRDALDSGEHAAKLLPIFSVVRFPNDVCEGSSRNGTCYTSEECSNKGGSSSGSCASGYGVCCIFTLSCGESSSENCTYLVQTSKTTWTSTPCYYQICKVSSNVCRIRYDFTSMVISGPQTDSTAATAANIVSTQTGDCTGDTLTFTSAKNGPPVICGTNTGQHLYVDADNNCHLANINIMSSDSSTSRSWDVKVTQYECDTEKGGPPGCLQYFTGTTGSVASFNFPTGSSVTATATHLSSQDYSICFRRASSYCSICFIPAIVISPSATSTQSSFGLSISPSATIAQSATDTSCTTDYIEILDGNTITIAAISSIVKGVYRVCGRVWATSAAQAIASTISVCTRRRPFRLRFVTNEDEVGLTTGTSTGITAEADTDPGGIVGFKLNFAQQSC